MQVAQCGAADVPYVMIVLDHIEAQKLFDSDGNVKSLLDSVIAAYGEVSVSLLLIGFQRNLVTLGRQDHAHAIRTGMLPPPLYAAAAHCGCSVSFPVPHCCIRMCRASR